MSSELRCNKCYKLHSPHDILGVLLYLLWCTVNDELLLLLLLLLLSLLLLLLLSLFLLLLTIILLFYFLFNIWKGGGNYTLISNRPQHHKVEDI